MKKILAFIFATSSLFSQTDYPSDFISPLSIPLDFSGSFGELRSNHFHSGLDMKTNSQQGLDVFAVADGYISRIKISSYGYGKAIYITHPNGYTTVYGHLQRANGVIEDFIKQEQYKKKSFEVEMFPGPNELPVKQGEVIAFSGNSGGSGGPHLHFEFRETKTEKIVNPLYFGYTKFVKDKFRPNLQGIMVYPMDSVVVNKSRKPILVSFNKQADGNYVSSKVVANGKIGFAINAYDNCTNGYNRNGLFKVNAYLNGVLYYEYEFDKFAFNESRYINNFIDYEVFKTKKQRFQKLFFNTAYPLSVLKKDKHNGIINTQPNANYTLRIEMFDFHGNQTNVSIPIEYGTEIVQQEDTTPVLPYLMKSRIENNFTKDNVSVYVPENAFYDDFRFNFEVNDGVLVFGNETIPVHKNITITYANIEGLREELKEKTFIASVDGKSLDYNATKRSGNNFSTRVRNLGEFKLAQDTIAPRIYNMSFEQGKNLSKNKTFSVLISDNLSGIDTYNAYLNGEWILMEYDYKTRKLVHDLADKKYMEGKNELKIIVTDNLQNSTTFETHFFMNN
ncbi:M23 family metallopeptidase [Flavobacterium chuncheonense]|uniref:M23 family metallopeptidase n=1 Tax=Flavobacterium chuncheonense TaxID=2026653 RepID=A0ABW5YIG2_9FLAO